METGIGDWYVREPKCLGIYNVLHRLMQFPKEGLALVGKDKENDATTFFNTHSGGLTVPVADGARVIFLGPKEGEVYNGDGRLAVGSSVIIRVLPVLPDGVSYNLTDAELMIWCLMDVAYPYWPPGSTEKFQLFKPHS